MLFGDAKGAAPLPRALEAVRVPRGDSAELAGAARGGRGEQQPPRPLRGAPVPREAADGAVRRRSERGGETPGAAHPVGLRVGGAESRERAVTR